MFLPSPERLVNTRRKNNVIMTSKRRCFDVIMTLSFRHVPVGLSQLQLGDAAVVSGLGRQSLDFVVFMDAGSWWGLWMFLDPNTPFFGGILKVPETPFSVEAPCNNDKEGLFLIDQVHTGHTYWCISGSYSLCECWSFRISIDRRYGANFVVIDVATQVFVMPLIDDKVGIMTVFNVMFAIRLTESEQGEGDRNTEGNCFYHCQ